MRKLELKSKRYVRTLNNMVAIQSVIVTKNFDIEIINNKDIKIFNLYLNSQQIFINNAHENYINRLFVIMQA